MNATKEIMAIVRCKAFSGQGVKNHRVMVECDGSVLVWDVIAGHYTRCHSLSKSTQRKIAKKLLK